MDNAVNALLIAGGVLIAIIVLTIGTYLVGKLGGTAESYTTQLDQVALQKYNSNFEIYNGRNDITAQEVVTAVSIARQKQQGTTIIVKTDITENVTEMSNSDFEEWKTTFLNNNILKYTGDPDNIISENLFTHLENQYDQIGKIISVTFEKNI